MNLSVGIVGLPNVGKSTLFNALLKKQQALAVNYPFATIEPNVGVVPVPDERLRKLAEITAQEIAGPATRSVPRLSSKRAPSLSLGPLQSAPASLAGAANADARFGSPSLVSPALPPIVSATVEFVDIAGLVKGAAEGAGLGNKFLSHIREVSVISHVVRAFVDENVIREGSSDPETDYATIQTELILADLQSAENQESRNKNPEQKKVLRRIISDLNAGIPARQMHFSDEEKEIVKYFFFLTAKPEIIVLNVNEDDYILINIPTLTAKYAEILQVPESRFVVICAKIEAELANLSEEEQKEYLKDLGFATSGLERLIQKAYQELGLISFLTAGEKEVRAWTMHKGGKAVEAAGEIHTDFMKKFIKAEVISYNDYVEVGGRKKAREAGKTRLEGKDYVVQDGDVIEFKIGS